MKVFSLFVMVLALSVILAAMLTINTDEVLWLVPVMAVFTLSAVCLAVSLYGERLRSRRS